MSIWANKSGFAFTFYPLLPSIKVGTNDVFEMSPQTAWVSVGCMFSVSVSPPLSNFRCVCEFVCVCVCAEGGGCPWIALKNPREG